MKTIALCYGLPAVAFISLLGIGVPAEALATHTASFAGGAILMWGLDLFVRAKSEI